jgi:hypothetical protein
VQIIRRVNDVHIKNQTINHCFVIKLNKNDQFFSVAQDLKKPKTKTKHLHQDSRPKPNIGTKTQDQELKKTKNFLGFKTKTKIFFSKFYFFGKKNFFSGWKIVQIFISISSVICT